MGYYQKYQKYKFKYLNLLSLNQSGGMMSPLDIEQQLKIVKGLKNVQHNEMTREQYYYICEAAVKNNGLELEYVNTHKIMDFNLYNNICTLAVNNNSDALQHIVNNIISPDQYYEICKLAIKKDKTALKYVDKFELADIKYEKINNYESLVNLAK